MTELLGLSADGVLSTTRSARKRLDFTRVYSELDTKSASYVRKVGRPPSSSGVQEGQQREGLSTRACRRRSRGPLR